MSRNPQLNELVERCLAAMEQEGAPALERLCALHPNEASALRRRVALLQGFGLAGDAAADAEPAADPPIPKRLGDFELLERIGAGGMGVVYRARQLSLGREVALKVVRPDQLHVGTARTRFRREVEAIARLQHPGIVPIHAVGESDGLPWFAMELLTGASIAQVVRALHGRAPAELSGADFAAAVADVVRGGSGGAGGAPGAAVESADVAHGWLFAGTWSDVCLRVARQVADALAHAHGRGVLHRDVKPSNILVTPTGRVVLVDFGLASTGDVSELTKSGSALGSLPYMSPEQLRGEWANVDERSDLWSLGITLHELLMLELPWRETTEHAMREAIVAGRRIAPRERNPAVPRDVETVVLAATDLDRARRYARATDLARDLDNALTGRPIEARRVGTFGRLIRWARREPAQAATAALALLIGVGGPIAYAEIQRRASTRLHEANLQIRAEQTRAEGHFRHALGVLSSMLAPVTDDAFADEPESDPIRRATLERALALYESFPAEDAGDFELRRALAQALFDLSLVQMRVGAPAAAATMLREAVRRLETLAGERTGDSAIAFDRLKVRGALGSTLTAGGRMEEGRQVVDLLITELGAGDPHDLPRLRLLAKAQSDRGVLAHLEGDLAGAITAARAALAVRREVIDAPDAVDGDRCEFGDAAYLLSDHLLSSRHEEPIEGETDTEGEQRVERLGAEADALQQEALAEIARVLAVQPRDRRALTIRCELLIYQSMVHALKATSTARIEVREALAIAEQLAQRYPESVAVRRLPVEAGYRAAVLELQMRDEAAAVALVRTAIEHGRAAYQELHEPKPIGAQLAPALSVLAQIELQRNQTDAGMADLAEAIELGHRCLTLTGGGEPIRRSLRQWEWLLARQRLQKGDWQTAAADAERFVLDPADAAPGSTEPFRAAMVLAGCAVAADRASKQDADSADEPSKLAERATLAGRADELARQAIAQAEAAVEGWPALRERLAEDTDWAALCRIPRLLEKVREHHLPEPRR